jgi:hypothetical protein
MGHRGFLRLQVNYRAEKDKNRLYTHVIQSSAIPPAPKEGVFILIMI